MSERPSKEILHEAAIAALPQTTAYELYAYPISYFDGILAVGMVSIDKESIEKIKFATRVPNVEVEVMDIDNIRNGLKQAYPKQQKDGNIDDVRSILQKILDEASRRHAQDIFIEPASQQAKTGQVRFAIDGKLHWSERYSLLSADIFARLLGYVYNQAEIQPMNRNIPGDGRITQQAEGRSIDLRISYIPMSDLGCINMRVLSNLLVLRDLRDLGMSEDSYKAFSDGMKRPSTFITIAGPTGEGKSTTAYAAIKELDLAGQNICSIENPIECYIDGVKQIGISAEANRTSDKGQMTFADAARALMRGYPQFVFLGEVRDKETLGIANLMSTTGISLILTTHAPNAIKTILRFEALGATRQQITQAMTMAVSQRLLWKLCPNCKELHNKVGSLTLKIANLFGIDFSKSEIYKANPKGCERCKYLGYNDRVGAFEILDFTPEIIEALVASESLTEIGHIAIENGYRPMVVTALEHLANGDTDEDEIRRRLSYIEVLAYIRPGKKPPQAINQNEKDDNNSPKLRAV